MRAAKLDSSLTEDIEKEIKTEWVKLYNDGVNYINEKKYEKAIETLLDATHLDPRKVDNYIALSNAYNLAGHPDEAYLSSERAIQLDPGNVYALDNMAVYHFNKNDFKESVKYFEMIIAEHPDNKRAIELAADCYEKIGDYQNAREKFAALMELEPDNPDAVVNASALEIIAKDWERAKALCEKGIERFPDNSDLIINYVMACKNLDIVDQALATIKTAMENNPDNADIAIAYASALFDLGKYKDVIKTLKDSGFTFDENTQEGLRLLGLSYMQQKQYHDAIKAMEELIVYAPDDKNIYSLLSKAYYKIGEKTMADFYFQEAQRLSAMEVSE